MGTYNEPRVPSGAPVDGERDVWLNGGKVKFGHYVAASSSWVVDLELDYNGVDEADTLDGYHAVSFALSNHDHTGTYATANHNHTGTYEPVITKNTGFNKNLGAVAGTVSEGNHTHGGTFSGDADTLDGKHAAAFMDAAADSWHTVGATGEPAFNSEWSVQGDWPVKFKNCNGMVHFVGRARHDGTIYSMFTLPTGYRPSVDLTFPGRAYDSNGIRAVTIKANGEIDADGSSGTIAYLDGISFLTT